MHASPQRDQLSLLGQPARYATGLEDLGGGLFAWLQPNGELGESNAGLVVGAGESLLIDTLWDLRLTRRMLDALAPHTAAAPITRLVNTHGDGDHCWGNQLLPGVEIIATRACAEDMTREDPKRLRLLSGAGTALSGLDGRRLRSQATRLGQLWSRAPLPGAGKLAGLSAFVRMLSAYDFEGVEITAPTLTFQRRHELDVGGRSVELIEVGPAHTPGDLIAHVPDERVVFAGDLVFVGVTPIMWVGPVENWISGLDRITEIAPRKVVPGHGPTTDLEGVRAMRAYWEFVAAAVRERLANGLDPYAAARDIVRSREFAEQPFSEWDARERIAINAAVLARSDSGGRGRVPEQTRLRLLAQMGELGAELRRAQ
jgi:glyoxylase-like metal-dependent hydrolase (beta-lactamase superfamily II)